MVDVALRKISCGAASRSKGTTVPNLAACRHRSQFWLRRGPVWCWPPFRPEAPQPTLFASTHGRADPHLGKAERLR
jgi:hypothetical protein